MSNPENEIMKCFESDIQYENKRYEVRLVWKLEKWHLDDNRGIVEDRLVKLNRKIYKKSLIIFLI